MIFELALALSVAFVFFTLSVLLAYMIKKYNMALTRAMGFFVGLTILKLSSLIIFSYFLSKKNGNIFIFLVVFATAFSLMLVPEIIIITKVFTR